MSTFDPYRYVILPSIAGLLTAAVGGLVGKIFAPLLKPDLPDECHTWNNFRLMEISLFVTGFIIYVIMQFITYRVYARWQSALKY